MHDPLDAHRLLQSLGKPGSPCVLDVRSGWEYRRGRIPGAVHAPFWALWRLLRADEEAGAAGLVVTCGHGPRAWVAVAWLRLAGARPARLLRGHMRRWHQLGLPLER